MYHFYVCFRCLVKLFILVCSSCLVVMFYLIQMVIFNGKCYNLLPPLAEKVLYLDEIDLFMTPNFQRCSSEITRIIPFCLFFV